MQQDLDSIVSSTMDVLVDSISKQLPEWDGGPRARFQEQGVTKMFTCKLGNKEFEVRLIVEVEKMGVRCPHCNEISTAPIPDWQNRGGPGRLLYVCPDCCHKFPDHVPPPSV
jgi:hypothetical protein